MTPLRSLPVDLTSLNQTTAAILGIGGVIALIGAWLRWIQPRWHNVRNDVVGIRDAVVGRPAIYDSITGEERVPALPGMGVRQAQTERQLELLTTTVAKLVDQEAAISELRLKVLQHDGDIAILQAAAVERVASKVEQTELWKTLQRLQDDDPTLDGDVDDDPDNNGE